MTNSLLGVMVKQSVESSAIKTIDYYEKQKILEIEFHSGDIYQYFNVPKEIYENLKEAESKGKYYIASIRNVYKFKKV